MKKSEISDLSKDWLVDLRKLAEAARDLGRSSPSDAANERFHRAASPDIVIALLDRLFEAERTNNLAFGLGYERACYSPDAIDILSIISAPEFDGLSPSDISRKLMIKFEGNVNPALIKAVIERMKCKKPALPAGRAGLKV